MKRFLTIPLLFWLLLSTAGFSVQKHFCKGELDYTGVKVMPGQHKGACGCEGDAPSSCCDNNEERFRTDQDYSFNAFSFQFNKTFAFALIQTVFRDAFNSGSDNKSILFREYSPPALLKNIPVRIQSFLL